MPLSPKNPFLSLLPPQAKGTGTPSYGGGVPTGGGRYSQGNPFLSLLPPGLDRPPPPPEPKHGFFNDYIQPVVDFAKEQVTPPALIRLGPAIAGGELGAAAGLAFGPASPLTVPIGAALGAGVGGFLGEVGAEKYEGRPQVDYGEALLQGGLNAIPAGPAGGALARMTESAAAKGLAVPLAKRAGLHIAEGATQGVLGAAGQSLYQEQRFPTGQEVATGAVTGGALGGTLGLGLERLFHSGKITREQAEKAWAGSGQQQPLFPGAEPRALPEPFRPSPEPPPFKLPPEPPPGPQLEFPFADRQIPLDLPFEEQGPWPEPLGPRQPPPPDENGQGLIDFNPLPPIQPEQGGLFPGVRPEPIPPSVPEVVATPESQAQRSLELDQHALPIGPDRGDVTTGQQPARDVDNRLMNAIVRDPIIGERAPEAAAEIERLRNVREAKLDAERHVGTDRAIRLRELGWEEADMALMDRGQADALILDGIPKPPPTPPKTTGQQGADTLQQRVRAHAGGTAELHRLRQARDIKEDVANVHGERQAAALRKLGWDDEALARIGQDEGRVYLGAPNGGRRLGDHPEADARIRARRPLAELEIAQAAAPPPPPPPAAEIAPGQNQYHFRRNGKFEPVNVKDADIPLTKGVPQGVRTQRFQHGTRQDVFDPVADKALPKAIQLVVNEHGLKLPNRKLKQFGRGAFHTVYDLGDATKGPWAGTQLVLRVGRDQDRVPNRPWMIPLIETYNVGGSVADVTVRSYAREEVPGKTEVQFERDRIALEREIRSDQGTNGERFQMDDLHDRNVRYIKDPDAPDGYRLVVSDFGAANYEGVDINRQSPIVSRAELNEGLPKQSEKPIVPANEAQTQAQKGQFKVKESSSVAELPAPKDIVALSRTGGGGSSSVVSGLQGVVQRILRAVGSGAEGLGVRHLEEGVRYDWEKKQYTSLVGSRLNPKAPHESLAFLSRINRAPFEVFHLVGKGKGGEIVEHFAWTSGQSGMVSLRSPEIARQIARLSADGGVHEIVIMHNHPGGNPSASIADGTHFKALQDKNPKVKAEIIIDHTRYAVMDGTRTEVGQAREFGPDYLKELGPTDPLFQKGQVVGHETQWKENEILARLAKSTFGNENAPRAVFLSNNGVIRGLDAIPLSAMKDHAAMSKYLEAQTARVGGHFVVLVHEPADALSAQHFQALTNKLVEQGSVHFGVSVGKEGVSKLKPNTRNSQLEFGRRMDEPAERVMQDKEHPNRDQFLHFYERTKSVGYDTKEEAGRQFLQGMENIYGDAKDWPEIKATAKEIVATDGQVRQDKYERQDYQERLLGKRAVRGEKAGQAFADSKLPFVQDVRVTFEDGKVHYDSIKGLNKGHAMARAKANWDGAKIDALTPGEYAFARRLEDALDDAKRSLNKDEVRQDPVIDEDVRMEAGKRIRAGALFKGMAHDRSFATSFRDAVLSSADRTLPRENGFVYSVQESQGFVPALEHWYGYRRDGKITAAAKVKHNQIESWAGTGREAGLILRKVMKDHPNLDIDFESLSKFSSEAIAKYVEGNGRYTQHILERLNGRESRYEAANTDLEDAARSRDTPGEATEGQLPQRNEGQVKQDPVVEDQQDFLAVDRPNRDVAEEVAQQGRDAFPPPVRPRDVDLAAANERGRARPIPPPENAKPGGNPDNAINLKKDMAGLPDEDQNAILERFHEVNDQLARGKLQKLDEAEMVKQASKYFEGQSEEELIAKFKKAGRPLNAPEMRAAWMVWRDKEADATKLRGAWEKAGKLPEGPAREAWDRAVTEATGYGMFFANKKTEAARILKSLDMAKSGEVDPTLKFFGRLMAGLRQQGLKDKTVADLINIYKTKPEDFADALRTAVHPTWGAKLLEFWKAGLVSGPATRLANVGSNAIFRVARDVENTIATGVDMARVAAFGGQRERFLGETTAAWAGYKAEMHEAIRQWVAEKGGYTLQPLKEGLGGSFEDTGRANVGSIGGKFGELVRIPFKNLEVDDAFFKHLSAGQEVYRRAYRAARKESRSGTLPKDQVTRRMSEIAAEMMDVVKNKDSSPHYDKYQSQLQQIQDTFKRDTFQLPLESLGTAIQNITRNSKLANLILPFVKTPANIAKETIYRTPAAFLFKAYREKVAGFRKGGEASGMAAEELAKTIVGSTIGAAVAMAAYEGLFTGGGPADSKREAALRETGWQPYSIKVGNQYVSYQRLEPLAGIVGLAADLAEAVKAGETATTGQKVSKIVGAIQENLTNKTFLSGLEGFFTFWHDPQRYARRFITQLEASAVPNIVGSAAKAIDPNYRKTEIGISPIAAKIPGVSRLLPSQKSPTGEDRLRPGSALERAVSPLTRSEVKTGPNAQVAAEMERVNFIPSTQTSYVTVGRKQVQLRDSESTSLEQARTKATAALARVVIDPTYQALPDNEGDPKWRFGRTTKRDVLEKVYRKYLNEARQRINPAIFKRLRSAEAN